MTRTDAEVSCRSRNGTLATVLNSKTQSFISHLLSNGGNYYYWIGGKLDVMDQLTWVDCNPYSGQWKGHLADKNFIIRLLYKDTY